MTRFINDCIGGGGGGCDVGSARQINDDARGKRGGGRSMMMQEAGGGDVGNMRRMSFNECFISEFVPLPLPTLFSLVSLLRPRLGRSEGAFGLLAPFFPVSPAADSLGS